MRNTFERNNESATRGRDRSALTLFLIGLLASVALFACSSDPETALAPAPKISPTSLSALLAGDAAPLVVDVRSAEEFAAGHLPGALHIPYAEIGDRLAELQSPNGVALYCMVGPRARKAEATLQAKGYTQILHIDGGYSAWAAAGLPTE